MERLTFEGNFCDIAQCKEIPCPYNDACSARKVWERLKAYEDTGFAPQAFGVAVRAEKALADVDWTIERAAELIRADKEGHVVVLPCKVGDTVYVSYGEGYRPCVVDRIHVLSKNEVQIRARYPTTETLSISASDFSKTVFLTREEAEESLRRAD